MSVSSERQLPMREVVPSPCVSICALDEHDVCVGCFRTGMEISQWGRLPSAQQAEVVKRCELRMGGKAAPCLIAEGDGLTG